MGCCTLLLPDSFYAELFYDVALLYRCEATWGILASGQRIASRHIACVSVDGVFVGRDITKMRNESNANPFVSERAL